MEWHVTSSTTTGEMNLWLDDVEVASAHATGPTQTAPMAGRFSVGAFLFAVPTPLPAHDLWFDDVIVNGSRVGCDR